MRQAHVRLFDGECGELRCCDATITLRSCFVSEHHSLMINTTLLCVRVPIVMNVETPSNTLLYLCYTIILLTIHAVLSHSQPRDEFWLGTEVTFIDRITVVRSNIVWSLVLVFPFASLLLLLLLRIVLSVSTSVCCSFPGSRRSTCLGHDGHTSKRPE